MKYFQFPLLIFIPLLLTIEGFSRNKEHDTLRPKKISLKLYTNVLYETIESSIYYNPFTLITTNKDFSLNITPAIRFENKKGNMHEIELNHIEFSNNDRETIILYDTTTIPINVKFPYIISEQRTTTFGLIIRYEYDYVFLKNKGNKIKPYIGASIKPFYDITATSYPKGTGGYPYPSKHQNIGAVFSLISGANWNISERVYFNINIPYDIIITTLKTTKIDNPALPESIRKLSTIDLHFFPKRFQLRFGFGVKI